jgi:hypothetical protein
MSDYLDKGCACLTGPMECHIILNRGLLAFRFGPMSAPEAGAILAQCQEEKIPALMTTNFPGAPFDWEFARDLRGYPEGEKPEESS